MGTISYVLGITINFAVFSAYNAQAIWNPQTYFAYPERIDCGQEALAAIQEHANEFNQKRIIKVADNIYMAIGYALGNTIMLIGPYGVVIVDVTESVHSAREILFEFRKLTNKPITDIIYTHNHADHTYGAKGFVEDENNPPNVWAHKKILDVFSSSFSGVYMSHHVRSMRMSGVFLPPLSAGIGYTLNSGRNGSLVGIIIPNKLVDDGETDVTLAGMYLKIVYIPGETDDQIGVWVPKKRAFLCADNLYRSFPNLYSIRGTKSRDLMQWVGSLDKMIDLGPDMLVPSHTRPVLGREKVLKLLIEYRDAIQYVHDQSVRLINHGFHPDEIGNMVQLPKQLQANPFLTEFYGSVKWSAKSVFTNYQGWFSGDPVELDPLTPSEKAERMVKLVGVKKLMFTATKAMKTKDFQWALELSSYVLRQDPSNRGARHLKIEALTALGSRQISTTGRNYYMTYALEEANILTIRIPSSVTESTFESFPIEYVISGFSVLFRPEVCGNRYETVYIELRDPASHHFIQLRNGIAIVRHYAPHYWNTKILTTDRIWRDILLQKRDAVDAIAMGDVVIEGDALALATFMDCFDKDVQFQLNPVVQNQSTCRTK